MDALILGLLGGIFVLLTGCLAALIHVANLLEVGCAELKLFRLEAKQRHLADKIEGLDEDTTDTEGRESAEAPSDAVDAAAPGRRASS